MTADEPRPTAGHGGTPAGAPSRRFPTALLAGYAAGLGIGLGAIPIGAWLFTSTRDPMGMGYVAFVGAGGLTGILLLTVGSVISLARRERWRGAAIANLVAVGLALAAVLLTALLARA